MAVTVPNYLKNLTRSIKYATVDVSKEIAPNMHEFAETNKEFMVSTYSVLKNPKASIRKKVESFTQSKTFKAIEYGTKNVFSDLLTGKFYNKERENQDSLKFAGSSFDTSDWDNLTEFGIDEDWESKLDKPGGTKHDDVVTTGDQQVIGAIEGSNAAATAATVNAVISSSKYNAGIAKANTSMLYQQNERLFGGLHKDLGVVGQTLANIQNINQKALGNIDSNMASFFTDSLKIQQENNAILKEIRDMQRDQYKSAKLREQEQQKNRRDIKGWNDINVGGMPDFKEYFSFVKDNITKELNNTAGFANMFGEDSNMLAMMLTSPLSFIPKAMVKSFIPNLTKQYITRLDESISGVFGNIIASISNQREKGGPLGLLGKIFGVSTSVNTNIDTSKYEKGPIPFDGITRKSIIEVIPTYLRRIEARLGGTEEIVFDYNTGKWNKFNKVSKLAKERKQSAINSSTRDIEDLVLGSKSLKEYRDKLKGSYDEESFDKAIDELKAYLWDHNGKFNPRVKANKNDIYAYNYPNLYHHYDAIVKAYLDSDLNTKGQHTKNSVRLGTSSKVMQAKAALNNQYRNMEYESTSLESQYASIKDIGINKHGTFDKKDAFAATNKLLESKDSLGNSVYDYLQNLNKELTWQRQNWMLGGISGTIAADTADNNKKAPEFTDFDKINLTNKELLKNSTGGNSAYRARYKVKPVKEEKTEEKKGFFAKLFEKSEVGGFFNAVKEATVESVNNVLVSVDQGIYDMMYKADVEEVDSNGNPTGQTGSFIQTMKTSFVNHVDDLFKTVKEKFSRNVIDPFIKKLDEWGVNHDKGQFVSTLKDIGRKIGTKFIDANKEVWGGLFKTDTETPTVHTPTEEELAKAAAKEAQISKINDRRNIRKQMLSRKATSTYLNKELEGAMHSSSTLENTFGVYADQSKYVGATDNFYSSLRGMYDWINQNVPEENRQTELDNLEKLNNAVRRGFIPANEAMLQIRNRAYRLRTKYYASGTMGRPFMGTSALSRNELLFNSKGVSRVNKTGVYNITEPTHILNSEDSYDLMKLNGIKTAGPKSTISKDLASEKNAINKISRHAAGTPSNVVSMEEVREIKENAKTYAPQLAAGGVAGAGLGLLVGAPLVGGAVGAAAMLMRKSNKLADIVFGKQLTDEQGGGRAGGLISRQVQETIKKYAPNMTKYGLAGIIPGLITPLGPVGGLLIGSAIGFMKTNQDFKEKVFGNFKEVSNKDKEAAAKTLKGAGIGAGVGAGISLIFGGPFGLMGNAILGSAVGMMSTTEDFKDLLFGKKDQNGQRMSGVLGAITDAFEPLKQAGYEFKDRVIEILNKNIVKPLNDFITPFVRRIPRFAAAIPKMIKNAIDKKLMESEDSFLGRQLGRVAKVGRAVGKVGTGALGLVTSPLRILGGIGRGWTAKDISKGYADSMLAQERIDFMTERAKGANPDYDFYTFDKFLKGIGNKSTDNYKEAKEAYDLLDKARFSKDDVNKSRKKSFKNITSTLYRFKGANGRKLSNPEQKQLRRYIEQGNVDGIRTYLTVRDFTQADINSLMEGYGLQGQLKDFKKFNDSYNRYKDITATDQAEAITKSKDLLKSIGIDTDKFLNDKSYANRVMANFNTELLNREAGGQMTAKDTALLANPLNNPDTFVAKTLKEMTDYLKAIYEGKDPKSIEQAEQVQAAMEADKKRSDNIFDAARKSLKDTMGEDFEQLSEEDIASLTATPNTFGKAVMNVASWVDNTFLGKRLLKGRTLNGATKLLEEYGINKKSAKGEKVGKKIEELKKMGLTLEEAKSQGAGKLAEVLQAKIKLDKNARSTILKLDRKQFKDFEDIMQIYINTEIIDNDYTVTGDDVIALANHRWKISVISCNANRLAMAGKTYKDLGNLAKIVNMKPDEVRVAVLGQEEYDRQIGLLGKLNPNNSNEKEPEAEEGTPENPAQNGLGTLLLGGLSTIGSLAIGGAKLVGKAALGLGKAAVGGVKSLFSKKSSGETVSGYGTGGANAATSKIANGLTGGGSISGDVDKAGDGKSVVMTEEGPAKVVEKSDGSVEYDTSDNKTKDILNKRSFKEKLQEKMTKAQEKTSSIMEKVFNPKKESKGLGLLGKLFLGGLLLKSGILGKVWNGIIKPIWTEKIRPFLKETVFPKVKEIWNDKVKPFFGNLLKGAGNWVLNTGIPFLVKAIKAVIAAIFGKGSGDSTASAVGNAISHGASVGTVVGAAVNGLNGGTYRYGTSGSGQELVEKYGEDVQTEMYDEKGNKLTTSDIANGNYNKLYNAQGYEAKINSDGTYTFTNRVSPWFKYAGTVTNAAAHAFVNPNVARASTKLLTGALRVGKHVPGLKTVSKLASLAVKPTTGAINAAANAGSKYFGIAANPTIKERLTNWQINRQMKTAVEGVTKSGSVVEQTAEKISYLSNKTNKLYEKAAGDKVFKEVATSADNVLASSSDNILAKAATEGAEATAKNKGLVASIVEKTKNVIDKLAKNAKVQKFVTKVGNFFHVKDLKNFASTLFKTISEKMVLFVQKAEAKFGKKISEETAKKVAAKAIAIVFLVTDFVKGAVQAESILGVTKTSLPEELCAGLVNSLCNFLIIPSIIPGVPTVAQTILECIYKLGGKESNLKERQEEAEKEYQEYIDKTGSTISKEEYLKRKYSVTGKIKGFVTDKIAAAKDWYNNEDKGTLKATINDLKEGDFLGAGKNLLGTGVKTLMRPAVTAGKLAKGVLKGAGSVVGGVGKGLWSGVKGIGSSVKDLVTDHPLKALGDLGSGALGLVTNPIKGIGKGIKNVVGGVADAAKNSLAGRIAGKAVNGVKKLGSKIKGFFSKKKKKKKKKDKETNEDVQVQLASADSPYKKLLGYDADENPIYTTDKDVVGDNTNPNNPLNGIANDNISSGKATIFGAMKSGNLKELMKAKVDTKNPARGILGALAKKVALPFTMINKGMTNLSSKLVDEFSNREENKQLESTERELDRSNMDEALAVKDSFSSIKRAAGSAKKGFFARMLSNISKTTSNLVTSPFRSVKSVLGKVGEKYEAENENLDSANIDISADTATDTNNDTNTMTGNLKNIMGHTANTAFGPFRFIKKSISQIGSEFSNISTNVSDTEDKLMSDTLKSNKSVFSKDYWTMNIKNDDTISSPLKQYATAMAKVASAPIIIVKKIISKLASDMGPLGEWIKENFEGYEGFFGETKSGTSTTSNTTKSSNYVTVNGKKISGSTYAAQQSAALRANADRLTANYGKGYTKQIDPSVANLRYNAPGDTEYQTVGDSACGPVAAVNVLESFGRGSSAVKAATNMAINSGFKEKNGGTKPGFFKQYFSKAGLKTSMSKSISTIRNRLRRGIPTILMGKDPNGNSDTTPFGKTPHYVSVTGVDKNGRAIVQDPESRYDNQLYNINDLLRKTTFGTSIYGKGTWASSNQENGKQIYAYLIDKLGYTPEAAAGFIGCWVNESSLNPGSVEGDYIKGFPGADKLGDHVAMDKYVTQVLFPAHVGWGWTASKGKISSVPAKASTNGRTLATGAYLVDGYYYPGLGLAGYTGKLAKEVFEYPKVSGKAWYTLDNQMQYAKHLLQDLAYYKVLNEKSKTIKDPAAAANEVATRYEGCPNTESFRKPRIKAAVDAYNALSGNTYVYNADKSSDSYNASTGQVTTADGTSTDSTTETTESKKGILELISDVFNNSILGRALNAILGGGSSSSSSSTDGSSTDGSTSSGTVSTSGDGSAGVMNSSNITQGKAGTVKIATGLSRDKDGNYLNLPEEMKGSAAGLLSIAKREADDKYVEKRSNSDLGDPTANPGGNNWTKFGKWLWGDPSSPQNGWHPQNTAWCAAFISWCAQQAGVPNDVFHYTGGCLDDAKWFQAKGRLSTDLTKAQAGDIIYFDANKRKELNNSHVGILWSRTGSNVINTIEGNSANQVAFRTRSSSDPYVYGFARPDYKVPSYFNNENAGNVTTMGGDYSALGGNGEKPMSKYGQFVGSLYGKGSLNKYTYEYIDGKTVRYETPAQDLEDVRITNLMNSGRQSIPSEKDRNAIIRLKSKYGMGTGITTSESYTNPIYAKLLAAIYKAIMKVADNTGNLGVIVNILNDKLGVQVSAEEISDYAAKNTLKSELANTLLMDFGRLDPYGQQVDDRSMNIIIQQLNAIASE